MPAMNTAFCKKLSSILTPAQKAALGEWTILQQAGATGAPITTTATRSTARKTATRTQAKKATTRTRTAKASNTQQKLIDYFATHPGGWSAADLAAKTNIKPNILGRVLNAKNSPFRKNDDLWLMNQGPGATVSRKLTAGQRKAA